MHRLAVLALLLLAAGAAPAATAPRTPNNALVVDALPLLQDWVPAVPPEGKSPGKVSVRVLVDATGKIASARAVEPIADVALAAAAEQAVKQWTFTPGVEDSKPVAKSIDVPFDFSVKQARPTLLSPLPLQIRASPRTPAILRDAPLGDFPAALRDRGLPGAVHFTCIVLPDGEPLNVRILSASHADFVAAALIASPQWRFKPAMQGAVPVSAPLRGQVFYDDPVRSPAAILAANAITAPDGGAPEDRPTPVAIADAVWPLDALLKGEGGSASVEFTVNGGGRVTEVKVREASQPAFGAALAAAMETWSFQPAITNGRGVAVTLLRRVEFKAVPLYAEGKDDPFVRLVLLARQDAIRGAAGLDEKLVPLYRVTPTAPLSASGTGNAIIEFVIDRDGRARLPRIVSASRDDFGWAAATAIAQWIFKAPRRDGQPTEVKVQIPVEF